MPVAFVGHGEWMYREEPSYTFVPKGTTIYFYTEGLKNLRRGHGLDIVAWGEAVRGASPNQVGEPYKTIPNYTLKPHSDETRALYEYKTSDDVYPVFVDSETALCEADGAQPCEGGVHRCSGLFALPEVQGQQVMWVACRAADLTPTGDDQDSPQEWADLGGEAYGVNRAQVELGYTGPEIAFGLTPDQRAGIAAWLNGLSASDVQTWWDGLDAPQREALKEPDCNDQLEAILATYA